MDIHSLNAEQLTDKIETFKDRIETMQEYISDTEDDFTRSNLITHLQQYKMTLNLLQIEKRERTLSTYNKNEILENVENFESLKSQILNNLDLTQFNEKHLYMDLRRISNFNQLAGHIATSSRTFNSLGYINEIFLNQIPKSILLEKKIYINQKDIIQNDGISVLLNCESKHTSNSESYHYGSCISKHYDKASSYHHHTSQSEHWDNGDSVHFNETKSIHHNNSHSQHYQNSKYEHNDDCTYYIEKK